MREQVGYVIGWMATGVAIITLLGTGFFIFVLNINDRFVHPNGKMYWTVIVVGVTAAIVIFLIGRAIHYYSLRTAK